MFEKQKNSILSYLLFLCWPFLMLIYGFSRISYATTRNIIVAFYALYGYYLVYDEYIDSARHRDYFQEITTQPFSELFSMLGNYFTFQADSPDLLFNTLAFLVSRFTDNYRVFFLVIGGLLGMVFIKLVAEALAFYGQNKNKTNLIFVIFLLLTITPYTITSFRQFFATGIFAISLLGYFNTGSRKHLFYMFLTPLVHYSFWLVTPLVLFFVLIGRKNWIYYILIILSFFFTEQATQFLKMYGLGIDVGESLSRRLSGYTHDLYIEEVQEIQQGRYTILNNYIRWTSLFLLISMVYHKLKIKNFDGFSEKLYSFSLLLFAMVNVNVGIESISNRFGILYHILCFVFFIRLYTVNTIKVHNAFWLVSIAFLVLYFVINIRLQLEFMNVVLLFPFAPLSFAVNEDISVLSFLGL